MKIIKQDDSGRIVIDGEGQIIKVNKTIPSDSPAVLCNFTFDFGVDESYDGVRISVDGLNHTWPIRLSYWGGSMLGRHSVNSDERHPGTVISPNTAREIAQALLKAADYTEKKA